MNKILILISFIFILSFINAIYIIFNNNNFLFFKFISIILILFIIYASFIKEIFLPFLGICAYPPSLIPSAMYPSNTNFSIELNFNVPDGTKIIYWAANNDLLNDDFYNNPNDAYGSFKNSGIAIVNNNKTILHLNCPNKYKIPSGTILKKHIHYRIALPNNPILSDIKTIFINC